jgi:hypothetical protein
MRHFMLNGTTFSKLLLVCRVEPRQCLDSGRYELSNPGFLNPMSLHSMHFAANRQLAVGFPLIMIDMRMIDRSKIVSATAIDWLT